MSFARASSPLLRIMVLASVSASISPARADSGTLDRIRSSHILKLGFREASIPFSYLGTDQKPTGFSIDLCKVVAERVKAALKLETLDVVYTPVNASNRIPLLQNGTIDVECGSTTNTAERRKQVAFSLTTFVSQPKWLVRADSGISDPKELRDKKVVATQGSLSVPVVDKIKNDDQLGFSVLQAKDHGDSLLMLRTGRVSAWFEEDVLLAGQRATSPDPKALVMLPAVYGSFDDALMLRKDDPDFQALVNAALKEEMVSGAFTKLYQKWFVSPIPPSGKNLDLPMSGVLEALVARPDDPPKP